MKKMILLVMILLVSLSVSAYIPIVADYNNGNILPLNLSGVVVSYYNDTFLDTNGTTSINLQGLNFTAPYTFTVSMWFKPKSGAAGSSAALFSFNITNSSTNSYCLVRLTQAQTAFQVGYCSYNNIQWHPTSSTFNTNTWHHFVNVIQIFNKNTSGYLIRGNIYLDGNYIASGASDMVFPFNITSMQIGAGAGYTFFYNGSIRDFLLINKTMSQLEIANLYNNTKSKSISSYVKDEIYLDNITFYNDTPIFNIAVSPNGTYYTIDRNTNCINRLAKYNSSQNTSLYCLPTTADTYSRLLFIDSKSTIYAGRGASGYINVSRGNDTNWTSSLNFPCTDSAGLKGQGWNMGEDDLGNVYIGEYILGTGNERCGIIFKSSNNGLSWSMIYNDSVNNPNNASRHVHNIKFNPYNKCLYAGMGDSSNNSKIIRSCDYGSTWTNLYMGQLNGNNINIIAIAFTPKYRLFGSDGQRGIIRTIDDINFHEITGYDKRYQGWDSTYDNNTGIIYFGLQNMKNYNWGILATQNGEDFFEIYTAFINDTDDQGVKSMTNPTYGYKPMFSLQQQASTAFASGIIYTKNLSNLNNVIYALPLHENNGSKIYNFLSKNIDLKIANWSLDNILTTLNSANYTLSINNNFSLINRNYDGYYLMITARSYYNSKTSAYNFNLTNLTTYPYGYGFAQVFNGTDIYPQCENMDQCNVTILPNNRTLVYQYTSSTQPKFTSIATTITDNEYVWDGTTLTLTCSGTGAIGLTNMDAVAGSSGTYEVLHNGAFVAYSNSSNYTISSCSSWVFRPNDNTVEAEAALDRTSESLAKLLRFWGLIAGVLVLLVLMYYLYSGGIDLDTFAKIAFILVITGVAYVILLAVMEAI